VVITVGLVLIFAINIMNVRLCVASSHDEPKLTVRLFANHAPSTYIASLTDVTCSFGEAEVITASIKVICFVGLILVSLVITLGGAPNHDRIGFRFWRNPGAFTEYNGITGSMGGFLGLVSALINASFSFIGVETVRASPNSCRENH
jgi:amino acid permease